MVVGEGHVVGRGEPCAVVGDKDEKGVAEPVCLACLLHEPSYRPVGILHHTAAHVFAMELDSSVVWHHIGCMIAASEHCGEKRL